MRTSDDELRQGRLVFYTQDVGRLDGELDGFLEFSGARCAILIDREGHLVTRRGDAAGSSMEALRKSGKEKGKQTIRGGQSRAPKL